MDVWVAADSDTWRWDGQHWTALPDFYPGSPARGEALWVNAPGDAWLGAGQKYAYHWRGAVWAMTSLADNRTARALWGSGPSDVWTSDCMAGYLGHYAGDTIWLHLESVSSGVALWGSGTDNVWMIEVVCRFGPDSSYVGRSVITHWRGVSSIGTGPYGSVSVAKDTQFIFPQPLIAMWGSDPSDIWAVGEGGAIVHYDGMAWSQRTSPATASLRGIWGTAANDVWAVGEGGVMLHFDGFGWSTSVSPTTRTLRSVWASPAGDAWAVGDSGTVLRLAR